MGDNTGYGLHGDYLFGWKDNALQKAMDGRCAMDSCKQLKRQTDAQAMACTKHAMIKENIGDSCKIYSPLFLFFPSSSPPRYNIFEEN